MLGLRLRSDGFTIDAAVEALVEELSKLATTGSSDRDLVHRRQERKPYQNRRQQRSRYSGVAISDREPDERTQAAANQIVAHLAAAGRAAGFDVARSDDARTAYDSSC